MNNSPILSCEGLTKKYGRVTALDHIDLTVGRGKIVGLLGPNGSGKTTLIKIANGLIRPTSGNIYIDGKPVGTESKMIVSYLPDKNYFAFWMKVKDVFDLFEKFYDNFNRHKAADMCASLHISEGDMIKAMSKGTKEKVQLILVMSRDADLYLLDEPIAGVDPAARDYILETIIGNYNENGTVIISTHLITDIEKVLDDVIFIKDGSVILHEEAETLREKEGMSVDEIFRNYFRMPVYNRNGGAL